MGAETKTATVHRARWVAKDPGIVLSNGYVRVVGGRVDSIGSGRPPAGTVTDHGDGLLLPALVNAHTHLELSALSGRVPVAGGFRQWVGALIAERERLGPRRLAAGAEASIADLRESGTGAVGEISSLGLTRDLVAASGLGGYWFMEYLGNIDRPGTEPGPLGKGLTGSTAGHAPHTTAPGLLARLKAGTGRAGAIFSIHLAESEDEEEFIRTGCGPWAEFLKTRGIDFSRWGLPAHSPVQYLDGLGLLDDKTLCVHLLRADRADMAVLARRQSHVCICPRSNQALHGRLPDAAAMMQAGLAPCLGTDSLASASSLSVFDEMSFCAGAFPGLRPEAILAMATVNGAAALGLARHLGDLSPGKRAVMAFVPVSATSGPAALEAVVHRPAGAPVKPIPAEW